ncbi:MAG TPA: CDP-alcohol phosphatidyltransferase family protein [Candidatus Saccharimonadales bacterium]|nr:CDP-alcohol phosphatidyltransferase family protein [Candidatus Saccharimonadales bacterium]
MSQILNSVRDTVRLVMRQVARGLNTASGGKLHPDAVTLIGLAMHVPIAVLIATGHNVWAAVLLVIFGLFDTLDGELARLQHRASERGMLLDAATDRMKEVLLYMGAAYVLAYGTTPGHAVWAVAACGASLCVSYIKAKGESAVASKKTIPHAELNRMFKDGIAPFEVRMAILVLGLLANQLVWAVAIVALLATYTAFQRLIMISKKL